MGTTLLPGEGAFVCDKYDDSHFCWTRLTRVFDQLSAHKNGLFTLSFDDSHAGGMYNGVRTTSFVGTNGTSLNLPNVWIDDFNNSTYQIPTIKVGEAFFIENDQTNIEYWTRKFPGCWETFSNMTLKVASVSSNVFSFSFSNGIPKAPLAAMHDFGRLDGISLAVIPGYQRLVTTCHRCWQQCFWRRYSWCFH